MKSNQKIVLEEIDVIKLTETIGTGDFQMCPYPGAQ
jgi:hypothetical protein